MIRRFLLVSALLGLSPAQAAAADPAPRADMYPQKTLLKNWALSRCLGRAYGVKSAEDDAYRTAGAYFEFSHVQAERFAELEALADKYLRADYRGMAAGSFNTMKCIDLFHSRELDALAARLVRGRR